MRALRERAVEGRNAVLQLRELVGDVRRQQVAPRRDHLPELDEDRPEVLERAAQALAAAAAAAREPRPGRQPENEAQRPVEMGRADVVVEPVAHEHAVDREQPAGDAPSRSCGRPAGARRRATRDSRRSTASRSRSTSSRNSSTSRRTGRSRLSSVRYSARVARERVARAPPESRRVAREVPRGSARRRRR